MVTSLEKSQSVYVFEFINTDGVGKSLANRWLSEDTPYGTSHLCLLVRLTATRNWLS